MIGDGVGGMEEIYTIPVNEAFEHSCECPLCSMYNKLEEDAVDFTMGPSYMEDDIREMTDRMGFCRRHMEKLSASSNKLGNALILKTHFDRVIRDISELRAGGTPRPKGLFSRKQAVGDPVVDYVRKLDSSCFVCDRINNVFSRYVDTIFFLYKKDSTFRDKFKAANGFCTSHYGLLRELAPAKLGGEQCDSFIELLDGQYIENMERVRDDLEWFINKFDYKYANEPWKNAKDALPRAMTKCNSIV